MQENNLENNCINAIRILSNEMISKANSGHPGICLGAAPMMYTLYTKHLKVNPENPTWINRDRFILSAGHGSAMLYATLHLAGYKISIKDLEGFRKPGITPGHPELGITPGVDATTGPLGQGIATAVGVAIAQKHLEAVFNQNEKSDFIDHYTFTLCGDGDLQEGIAYEAMSLAAHLKLGKLIVLFDSNDIQLDGPTSLAHSESHENKFKAMGWHYQKVQDGNDVGAIDKAIAKAKKKNDQPSIIEVKTQIGFGAPNAGTSKVHGSPLNNEALISLKKALNWPSAPFEVPQDVYDEFRKNTSNKGLQKEKKWSLSTKKSKQDNLDFAKKVEAYFEDIQIDEQKLIELFKNETKRATREMSGLVLHEIIKSNPSLIGGSADLASSTKIKGPNGDFSDINPLGNNLNYGVREHAMGAAVNGITMHGGLRGYGAGFFVFSDYLKPAIRLAALSHIPSLFVFSHDSICVGEDGPTHQPIEQLAGLRTIPNLNVFRPCDYNEMIFSFKYALENKTTPSIIVTSRQAVTSYNAAKYDDFTKGAYAFNKIENPDFIIMSTGSEVELAMKVAAALENENLKVRVVSFSSMNIFDQQTCEYKSELLPKNVKKLAIELGSTMPWYKYSHNVLGLDTFGQSAPAGELLTLYKFTVADVISKVKEILN